VFLLNSPKRRDHVRQLLKESNERGTRLFSVQAFTFEEALTHFQGVLGYGAPQAQTKTSETISLTRAEFSNIEHFFHSASRRLHRARDQAKQLKHPQLEIPDYPSNTDEVFKLLRHLADRFRREAPRSSP